MPQYTLTYPSVGSSEEKMLDDVQTILKQNKIERELQDGFLLVVSEAFTNAVVHGNERNPQKSVKLLLDINNETLTADIIDEGHGGLKKIKQRRPPSMLSENGRGIDLMKHYAREVSFTETPEGGLRVSIRFDRKKHRTKSYS
jgi:anti-sigma regulatory factor (Ser/Thr protein kinase)